MTMRAPRFTAALFLLVSAAVLAIAHPPALAAAPKPQPSKTPDPRAWPTSYDATTITAKQLLDAAKAADGHADKDAAKTIRVRYTFKDGGLEGTEREVWSGDDYRSDTTVGPFVTAEGISAGQQWEQNENGYTLLKRGVHQRTEANIRALEKTDPGDDVRVLGRLHAPADVYVLRVAPPDGREERRFYDATTFRLVRRETAYLDKLVVTTYDDYRTVKGVTLPFRTTVSDGHPENDLVWTMTDLQIGVPVIPAEVDVPGSRRIPVTFASPTDVVHLPAHIDDWGRIIVRLTVNGRGLDFQLDSGSSSIVLDRDVARQLGLKVYGRWSQTTAGTYMTGHVVIPKVSIGTITMDDLVADALPFSYENDERTRVVGLLGYDFIAGCVLKIDYYHGTVDAIPYDAFKPPANAAELDAILDDQVPLVPLRVNDASGDHFILDTGADDVVVFNGFSRRHPSAVDDRSPKKVVSRAFNIVQADGVGGHLTLRAALFPEMQLGNVRYQDYLAFVMSGDQPAFEGEDTDGLIGASVLSAFDVYLDYANSRVLLVNNKYTKKFTPTPSPSASPSPAAQSLPAPSASPTP